MTLCKRSLSADFGPSISAKEPLSGFDPPRTAHAGSASRAGTVEWTALANDAPLLLDVTRLIWRRWDGHHPTGVDRVCLAYLNRFARDAQAVVQHRRMRKILNQESSAALFNLLREPGVNFRKEILRGALRFSLGKGCEGRGRLYLNLGHTSLSDTGFRAWLNKVDVRPVYFVHDLIPVTHPEFCRAGEREKHVERLRTVLQSAIGVIGNSQMTLNDLAAFASTERLPSPPSIAALLGSDALPAPTRRPQELGRPTFVILGTIEARKNHLMLLYVWARIAQRLGPDAPRLLVIGKRGWESEQVLDLLDRSETLKHAVTEIDHCDDQTLADHLARARALLFPSLVEGYGLPLVEALRAGVPVVASDLPVFREIAGDVPDYLDPLDGPAWERAILSYVEDGSARRSVQIRRVKSYRPPTWNDHFEAVESWLTTL